MNDHTVVGWASRYLDISGSVDPFETPGFRGLAQQQSTEFEAIACWKLDRLSRNTINLNKLFGWCLEHDKTVVSCSESIDLSTPSWSSLLANVIGFLTEGELESIRDRARSSEQSSGSRPGPEEGALRLHSGRVGQAVGSSSLTERIRRGGSPDRRRVPRLTDR